MQFKDYCKQWLDKQSRFIKISTRARYTVAIVNHLIPELGNLRIRDISAQTLQGLVFDLMDHGRLDGKGGLKLSSVIDLIVLLREIIGSFYRDNFLIMPSLKVKYPKAEAKSIDVFSKKEFNKIIKLLALMEEVEAIGIMLSLCAGLRVGEVCGLKWGDIDFRAGTIRINRTVQRIYEKADNGQSFSYVQADTPKTLSSNRIIPITRLMRNILIKHIGEASCYILSNSTTPMEPRAYRNIYNRFLKNNKIRQLKYHALRHTFATQIIENGADIKLASSILGHSKVAITMDLYVHPRLENKLNAMERLTKN